MGIRIDVTPYSIYVKPSGPRAVSQVKSLRGVKINPETGWGRYPVSPFIVKSLIEKFPDAEVSPEALVLAEYADKVLELEFRNIPDNLPDPPSKTEWWPHQKEAFYFLQKLYNSGFRGVGLFSDLGTGKSKVAVGLADYLKAQMTLCVGPKNSIMVWHKEFRKHAIRDYQIILPDVTCDVKERLRRIRLRIKNTKLPVVVVMNYEALWRPPLGEWVLDQIWDLVIADELHRIKDVRGRQSRFMADLRDRARHRIGLTGTPLHHTPLDIWAQYRFLDPGVWGEYKSFERRYGFLRNPNHKPNPQLEEEFSQKLYSIAFRASADVLKLPEAVYEHRYGFLAGESLSVYQQVEREVIAQIKEGKITIHNGLVRLIRLQQLTSGFVRDDKKELRVIGHEKEELLDDLLSDFPQGEPLVIFCEFHYELDAVKKVLEKHKLKASELSGRENSLPDWEQGKTDALVVQIRSGGVSVDLTRARYAIYYSLGLSLGDYEQSLKRIHRAGQTRPVTYIFLIIKDTIDERKMKYFEQKRDVIQGLLEEYQNM